jgi:hypothetical protein
MRIPITLLTMGILSILLGCGQNKYNGSTNDSSTTEKITKPAENITATKDQLERRAKSEVYCNARNIPVYKNPNALFVDPENNVTIRITEI